MDQRTKKLTMRPLTEIGDGINRLDVSRKRGERGLISIDDWIDETIQGLEEYTKNSKKRLITAASNSNYNLRLENRNEKKKQLYGYFKRQTNKIAHKMTWTWQRKGNLWRGIYIDSKFKV